MGNHPFFPIGENYLGGIEQRLARDPHKVKVGGSSPPPATMRGSQLLVVLSDAVNVVPQGKHGRFNSCPTHYHKTCAPTINTK